MNIKCCDRENYCFCCLHRNWMVKMVNSSVFSNSSSRTQPRFYIGCAYLNKSTQAFNGVKQTPQTQSRTEDKKKSLNERSELREKSTEHELNREKRAKFTWIQEIFFYSLEYCLASTLFFLFSIHPPLSIDVAVRFTNLNNDNVPFALTDTVEIVHHFRKQCKRTKRWSPLNFMKTPKEWAKWMKNAKKNSTLTTNYTTSIAEWNI